MPKSISGKTKVVVCLLYGFTVSTACHGTDEVKTAMAEDAGVSAPDGSWVDGVMSDILTIKANAIRDTELRKRIVRLDYEATTLMIKITNADDTFVWAGPLNVCAGPVP